MTHAQFFAKVIALNGTDKEMVEIANAYLASLAKKSEKAKEKRIAKNAENAPIEKAILDYLNSHKFALANELATVAEVSTSKIVAVCNPMVASGVVKCERKKFPKVGERNVYSVVKVDTESVVQ